MLKRAPSLTQLLGPRSIKPLTQPPRLRTPSCPVNRGIYSSSSASLSIPAPMFASSSTVPSVLSSRISSSLPSLSSLSWISSTASGSSCTRISCCIRGIDTTKSTNIVDSTQQFLDGLGERTCEFLDELLLRRDSLQPSPPSVADLDQAEILVPVAPVAQVSDLDITKPIVHIYQMQDSATSKITDSKSTDTLTAKSWKLEWAHMIDINAYNGEVNMDFLKMLSHIRFRSKSDAIEFAILQGWGYDLV
ncbi:hypothetical protein NADFUDRAFT_40924 [Nadsonia fulvescens var. elongata DSM 6958]|uniref:Uncharacterized protein n=1 Tax=Nadsonia fulvescens var. elongata DSM 6958 TaxID=857566 RepID=A0A1E3PN51_9ASCO|nr:hypothetical protein NADFUDRAFT_40924 [Nadsonia fulvescens var. elongata DSM 6958]